MRRYCCIVDPGIEDPTVATAITGRQPLVGTNVVCTLAFLPYLAGSSRQVYFSCVELDCSLHNICLCCSDHCGAVQLLKYSLIYAALTVGRYNILKAVTAGPKDYCVHPVWTKQTMELLCYCKVSKCLGSHRLVNGIHAQDSITPVR